MSKVVVITGASAGVGRAAAVNSPAGLRCRPDRPRCGTARDGRGRTAAAWDGAQCRSVADVADSAALDAAASRIEQSSGRSMSG